MNIAPSIILCKSFPVFFKINSIFQHYLRQFIEEGVYRPKLPFQFPDLKHYVVFLLLQRRHLLLNGVGKGSSIMLPPFTITKISRGHVFVK